MVEQRDGGNITRIVSFFLMHRTGQPLATAAEGMVTAVSMFPLGPSPSGAVPQGLERSELLITTLLLGAAAWCWSSRDRHPSRAADALLVSGAGALLVCFAAATRIHGPLYFYITYWMGALPLLVWLAVLLRLLAWADVQAPRRFLVLRNPKSVAFLLAVPLLITVVRSAGTDAPIDDHDPTVASVVALVAKEAEEIDASSIRIRQASYGNGEWRVVAGVVSTLDKRGYRLSVTSPWLPRYGARFEDNDQHDMDVVLGIPGLSKPERLMGTTCLDDAGPLLVYVGPNDPRLG
jgi:hypothetical protein